MKPSPPKGRFLNPSPNAWAEIDLKALRYNFRQLKKTAAAGTRLLGVVKAEAYGHGMLPVARLLTEEHVDWLGVADLNEGIELRRAGIRKPVLVFEHILPRHAECVPAYGLTPTVCSPVLASALNRSARKNKKTIRIHLKLDTGMGRLGVWHREVWPLIDKIRRMNHLVIDGIYTHFPSADTDPAFTRRQIGYLRDVVSGLKERGIHPVHVHAANSMGLAGYSSKIMTLARPGLMLYGLYPHARLKKSIPLKPVMTVKARIIFCKDMAKGRTVSYGRTFTARRPMRAATLAIGYSDGYLRSFSNKAAVLIRQTRCPVLGRVTMDLTVVDISRVPSAAAGEVAVILGAQKDRVISADELAGLSGTINYEVACNLGSRLPRVYKQ